MKANFCLIAVILIVLSSSLAGCVGSDEDQGYSGPINLVVHYDSTSGMVTKNYSGDELNSEERVELCFNFSGTTSEEGNITMVYLYHHEGRSSQSFSDDYTVLCYEWRVHGLFEIRLGAQDENNNTHDLQITVKINMKIVRIDWDTKSSTMQFDTSPCCVNGKPPPETLTVSSEVTNQEDLFFSADDTEVIWSLDNPDGEEVASHGSETIEDGETEWWDVVVDELTNGIWSLNIEANGDNINIKNQIIIRYPEGSEDPPNPRPQSI